VSCIAIDPNCADCARATPRQRHGEGDCDDLCSMACGLLATPDGHAAIHKAQHCRSCDIWSYDVDGAPNHVTSLCKHGNCVRWNCPNCAVYLGGYGPITCPCNTSWTTRLWLRLRSWRKTS
jgi:hypothetical protein